MIRILITFLLWLPLNCWSAARVELVFADNEIKVGSLVSAELRISPESLQVIEPQKLKGETFAKVLYFFEMGPLLKKSGEVIFTAPVKVVFTDVPQAWPLRDQLAGRPVEIYTSDIRLIPTQAEPELIFGSFEIPSAPRIMRWILLLIVSGVLLITGLIIFRALKKSRKIAFQKKQAKDELFSAQDFEGVVQVWKKKHYFVQQFPHVQEPLRNLEQVLFRYQFKPTQTESEQTEVIRAYRKFLSEIEGGFNGV